MELKNFTSPKQVAAIMVMMLLFCSNALAQSQTLAGLVSDQQGATLTGRDGLAEGHLPGVLWGVVLPAGFLQRPEIAFGATACQTDQLKQVVLQKY